MKDLQKAWRNIAQDQIKNDESGSLEAWDEEWLKTFPKHYRWKSNRIPFKTCWYELQNK